MNDENPLRTARRDPAWPRILIGLALAMMPACHHPSTSGPPSSTLIPAPAHERQITAGGRGRILTNTGVWSPDSQWIVYDTRSDAGGENFDGNTIEKINVLTGEVRELYRSANGAHCGVATWHPREPRIVFILGPENPTPDWQYCAWHRRGVIVSAANHGEPVQNLDARDIAPPFTPGALRGGSHVHVWDPLGKWVSFTYEDHVLALFREGTPTNDINQRNIGISVPVGPVRVSKGQTRNHDGAYFSVLVTRTVAAPRPGSDEIMKACEEGWIGTNGYVRKDGQRQLHALAFQGQVVSATGRQFPEVFVVDLPEDPTIPGDGPLQGTETRMPLPPKGCVQRRLTFTGDRLHPGLQGPRHWLRSSPDGSQIAFLMKDDAGKVQLWTISPSGGLPRQVTCNPFPIASAFTWNSDGTLIGHLMDNSVCVTEISSGITRRLTPPTDERRALRPEACVFSPDGKKLAYVRRIRDSNQIFVCSVE